MEAEKQNVDVDQVEIPIEGGGVANTRLERGRLRYSVRADVELLDRRGNRVGRSTASASANGRYELGIYEGDVRTLLLNNRQREQFDPAFLENVRRDIRERAAIELAQAVAARVFEGALEAVP